MYYTAILHHNWGKSKHINSKLNNFDESSMASFDKISDTCKVPEWATIGLLCTFWNKIDMDSPYFSLVVIFIWVYGWLIFKRKLQEYNVDWLSLPELDLVSQSGYYDSSCYLSWNCILGFMMPSPSKLHIWPLIP